MRRLEPLLLVSLMLAMIVAPTPKALIDFEVTSIVLGDSLAQAQTWEQPDSTNMEYVIRGQSIAVTMTFTQAGTSSQPAYAEGWMQVWHPIGFLVEEHYVNMTLSIDGGLADDNEVNNELDRHVPVAVWRDQMENGFCGDVDGDQVIDCTNMLSANEPTWVGAGYDSSGSLSSDPDNYGHWRMQNGSSSEGEFHWRVSRPGSDYASNRHDRLWWGWFTPFDNCDDPGHGLKYGTLDSAVSGMYGNNFCKIRVRSFDFISMHLVTHAWGEMAAGDQIRIETESGGSLEYFDYSAHTISNNEGEWTQLVWNMSEIHHNADYTLAFKFDSNSSIANQGIHLDNFLMFGFEKVAEYTLDLDCNDPLPNAYLTVPDDPIPPSLYCKIKNNGYVDITLRLYTEVSNKTWMNGYPLRIDSNNMFDHDNYVVSEVIGALDTMDTWFNLSIPEGASVQELDWFVWVNDGTTNLSKEYLELPVCIQELLAMWQ